MPAVRKLDLIPPELRAKLAQALTARGFGQIVETTEDLNFWLEEAGMELRLAKTQVGEYAKELKAQRASVDFAQLMLADWDIEAESEMHRALMHMIAGQAVQVMRKSLADDEALDPRDLHFLGKMLTDLMRSSGIRDKNVEAAEARAARKAREEAAGDAEKAAVAAGLSDEAASIIRRKVLGLAA